MQKDRYKRELESLSAKYDNIYGEEIANLIESQHKMFVGRDNFEKEFRETFRALAEEYVLLEKVELIDYWNWEHGRTD